MRAARSFAALRLAQVSRKSRDMSAAIVPVELPASWLPRAPRALRSNGISARRCCRCICSAKRSTADETAQRDRPADDDCRIAGRSGVACAGRVARGVGVAGEHAHMRALEATIVMRGDMAT
nr:hypothetical protein [Burkholderia ambifaria]